MVLQRARPPTPKRCLAGENWSRRSCCRVCKLPPLPGAVRRQWHSLAGLRQPSARDADMGSTSGQSMRRLVQGSPIHGRLGRRCCNALQLWIPPEARGGGTPDKVSGSGTPIASALKRMHSRAFGNAGLQRRWLSKRFLFQHLLWNCCVLHKVQDVSPLSSLPVRCDVQQDPRIRKGACLPLLHNGKVRTRNQQSHLLSRYSAFPANCKGGDG